ncbi:MAG TPA: hypothetical protein VLW75_10345 [Rhizomicrobium sp.]|nr:hypothetical protein [Rhizomicrobium sp.]
MALSLNKRVIRERALALVSRPNPAPLFVFGNQKSGTTAIAGLLAAATGQRLVSDFAGAKEPYIGKLLREETAISDYVRRNAWAFSLPVVKDPSLTFVAPQLMEYFGQARAAFVVRDPWANIRSILVRLELRGDTDRLVRTGTRRINRTWQCILAGSDLGLAERHFVSVLARRWTLAAQLSATPGCEVVRYEDFNAAKTATIESLAGRLGLAAIHDITSIADKPFQPSGDDGSDLAQFFGPANLKRISGICGPLAAKLGYAAPG